MPRPKLRAALLATALAVAAMALPAGAGAATVVNGDFETGNLSGWTVFNSSEEGDWYAYAGTESPRSTRTVPLPPQGNWAAMSDQNGPNTSILYQDVALEPYFGHNLSLILYYRSYAPIAVPSPNTLSTDVPHNQQLRVDVLRPAAPLDSLSPADVLATVFANAAGNPLEMAPTPLSANLTPFAGQTVRLRIANAVNDNAFTPGVDAVSITSTPPSNAFGRSKVQLTPGTGGGFLPINVPGPGVVTLVDARTKVAKATSSAKGAKKRVTRSVKRPAAAGKVLVPLHPTSAGFKALEERGKLKVRVRVTFTPTGGTAKTQSYTVTLKLTGGGGKAR